MQKIATRIFMGSSITFGVLGILMVLTSSGSDANPGILEKLLMISVFIILPSFALSVATKYLSHK